MNILPTWFGRNQSRIEKPTKPIVSKVENLENAIFQTVLKGFTLYYYNTFDFKIWTIQNDLH